MRFKESNNHKIVSLANAASVGRLARFVVDVPGRKVSALRLNKTEDKHRAFLPWESISAFGGDAVTVPDAGVLVTGDEAMETAADKHHQLIGKLALSTGGDEMGIVSDVDFDPVSGLLEQIHCTGGTARGDALVGIGSYAAVLDVD